MTTTAAIVDWQYTQVTGPGSNNDYVTMLSRGYYLVRSSQPGPDEKGHSVEPDDKIPLNIVGPGLYLWIISARANNLVIITRAKDATDQEQGLVEGIHNLVNAIPMVTPFSYKSPDFEWASQVFQNPCQLKSVKATTTNTSGWMYLFVLDAHTLPADGTLSPSIRIDDGKLTASGLPFERSYNKSVVNGVTVVGSTTPFPTLTTPTGSAATMLFNVELEF